VFAPGGGGQQHIGDFGGFGHKDILHHHKIERLNPFTHQTKSASVCSGSSPMM
jgi:hypothetical protein